MSKQVLGKQTTTGVVDLVAEEIVVMRDRLLALAIR